MLIKANNINFFIDAFNQTIKRSEFYSGTMLFSDVDSGEVPSNEDSAIFSSESKELKIFRYELECYLPEYQMALKKFRKLKAFI
jgi:hypothetical protein